MTQPPQPSPSGAPAGPPVPPIQPAVISTNHVLHLLLTLVTCGVWIPFWLLIYLQNEKLTKAQQDWYQQAVAEYTQARWEWDQRHAGR